MHIKLEAFLSRVQRRKPDLQTGNGARNDCR